MQLPQPSSYRRIWASLTFSAINRNVTGITPSLDVPLYLCDHRGDLEDVMRLLLTILACVVYVSPIGYVRFAEVFARAPVEPQVPAQENADSEADLTSVSRATLISG